MKTITINNQTFTMNQVGYGQYKVSNGLTTHYSTNSQAYDWIDDDEKEGKHNEAINYVVNLFQ